jgi:hypothetical protein
MIFLRQAGAIPFRNEYARDLRRLLPRKTPGPPSVVSIVVAVVVSTLLSDL